jgi:hypothetical protein
MQKNLGDKKRGTRQKAQDVEHLSYKRIDFKNFSPSEIPFLDLLPLNQGVHHRMVTPLKDVFRETFGRRLGNTTVANFLRGCLLFWYTISLSLILVLTLRKQVFAQCLVLQVSIVTSRIV